MTERDFPSVPVTTLAGLTSLSDLLSELPVSDSLLNVTSINKSLLFHTLVANESNNLLSVRDDNLVKQLVHAIEQTNSDNIELKSQYSIQHHGANISTYPELLQGIYNFRPTVFNTTHQKQLHTKQNTQQTSQIISGSFTRTADAHQPNLIFEEDVAMPSNTFYLQTENCNLPTGKEIKDEIFHLTNVTTKTQSELINNNLSSSAQTINEAKDDIISEQLTSKQVSQQISVIQTQSLSLESLTTQSNKNSIESTSQKHSKFQHIMSERSSPPKLSTHIQQKDPDLNNETLKVANEHQQPIQGNFQNVLNLQRQQEKLLVQQNHLSPKNKILLGEELLNKKPFLPNSSQTPNSSETCNQQQQLSKSKQTSANIHHVFDSDIDKKIPANTIYVDPTPIEEKNSDTSTFVNKSGKSQVRVCINRLKAEDALLMQQSIKEFVHKSPELANKLGLPVPTQMAATTDMTSAVNASNSFSFSAMAPGEIFANDIKKDLTSISDTFTMIKANEKRITTVKRKVATSVDDIPPDQIYSQPKVRRVERSGTTTTSKYSKEEVMRSQTYQQFMRNMDQIIEFLDDTESPNFESDDVDENIECISSKLLNTMSNDVAKLKAKQVLDSIPKNKLTLLINYAMRNIYVAKNYSAGPDDEDEIMDDEVMEKILNAIEACLLISNIYSTAKDLKFLQEDNIAVIIKFVQFQFRETIFPSYDPVYTVKNMKKSDTRKKGKTHHSHSRSLQLLYSKSVELMKVFVTLFDKCIFVDTIVLPLSTLSIEPFFVDNIETLQFVCLELITTIFRKEKYDKIRSSILGDILSSIDRLPSSKKNLRPFKLTNNGGNIQMITALVLQLIQCATILPQSLHEGASKRKLSPQTKDIDDREKKNDKPNYDVIILKKYEVAISIGGHFLTTFLNKCKSRSNEIDFRPLFENFIHDLLATVNKPEWPASELLLSLLGTMLVRYVSDKSIEQSIRLVSLDYLGIVAARLRKDTVESRCKVNIIDMMINSIKLEQEKEGDLQKRNSNIQLDPEEERTEFLQKIIMDFLAVNAQEDNLFWDYARNFYLAQWYRDIIYQRRRIADGEKGYASRKKSTAKKRRRKEGSYESDSSEFSESDDECNSTKIKNEGDIDQELNLEIFKALEERKGYLLNNIKPNAITSDKNASHHIKTYIDYNNAQLIAQYLATKRPFSQSFDGYLKKIILVVNEPAIAIRTRAMKCLASIVEVDPMVLKRKDMQMGVNQKFLDAAISVREAAVDLVGKFVLSNEELIDQYYDMLSTRILDTGVSVRKRVIKILRDICIEYPDFQKIPEICVKMIRRVNDEEGIQKLVTEVFMKMWFTPCIKNNKYGIQRKINQIIDVVNTAHDTGTSWLEGLLNSIFQPKENMLKMDGSIQEPVKKNTEPPQEIVLACQQLADGLVERLIELEDTDNARMLGCITTLHLLARVRPQLLVRHAITIEPYLNIRCHPSTAPKFICAVADILEKVVPLVNNASESFLASLEEHLMLLVVSLNQAVVTSCVSCLGALVNKITKNYKLIRDCFQKFYRILDLSRNQVIQNQQSVDTIYTPSFRRSLFTIGILMRYFDFKSPEVIGVINGLPASICDDAFDCLMFFIQCSNYEIRKQALVALGSFCVMNDDYLTKTELKRFYCDLLRTDTNEPNLKIICMRNIWMYLTESEMYMHNKEKEWEKQAKNEDLKEMNDVSSGMASRIIQLYLQEILDCFLNYDETVRLWAVKVIQIVLRQGLVHPVRMVPYLICLSTDCKVEAAHRADALLKEIDKTYSGFVNMKVQFGLQLCFKLQEILQYDTSSKNGYVIRGYVKRATDTMPSSLNDFLYTLLRTTKPQRRALVQTVTKQFDDQKTSLRQMLYIADNLAYFPYMVQDEPLYLIHQIDLLISMAGTNLLTTFKECLKPSEITYDIDDDDEEDPHILFKRLPENTIDIQKCITSAQACMLLLILKDHLKNMYGVTDGKISRYSPSEQKLYEKAVTRKNVPDFNPKTIIDVIHKQQDEILKNCTDNKRLLNEEEKMDLIAKYLDFKQLMLKLDPDDADSDEEAGEKTKLNNSVTETTSNTLEILNLTESGQVIDGTNVNSNTNSHTLPFTPAQITDSLNTPTSRASKQQSASLRTPLRKQAQRSKKKKRKVISSDEDDEDYSGDDFV